MADLQKPKKAPTAYFLFTGHIRETVSNELKAASFDGKANFGDIARGVKTRWDALSDAEKQVWVDKAAASKEAAAEAMQAYKEATKDLPPSPNTSKGKKGKERDEDKPKRAATAWQLFSAQHRSQVQEGLKAKGVSGKAIFAETAKGIKSLWDSASPEEKKKWEDQAAKCKEEVSVAMEAYKAQTDPVGTLKAKYADLIPKRPPLAAHQLFAADVEIRQKAETELKEQQLPCANSDITKKVAQVWEATEPSIKELWKTKHQKAMDEYKVKMEQWQKTPQYQEILACEEKMKNGKRGLSDDGLSESPDAKKNKN